MHQRRTTKRMWYSQELSIGRHAARRAWNGVWYVPDLCWQVKHDLRDIRTKGTGAVERLTLSEICGIALRGTKALAAIEFFLILRSLMQRVRGCSVL